MKCTFTSEITDEEIRNVELKLKFEFPEDFKEFIKINNGGYPEKDIFKLNGLNESINHFLTFKENVRGNIINSNVLEDLEGIRDTFVAIATDSFGNDIVFNREDKKIMFYEHEEEAKYYLADTFTEFLELLFSKE